MADLPYSFEPTPGYAEYKVTSMLKDYLGILMKDAENKETIEQILTLINGYTQQLRNIRKVNRVESTKEVYKAIDGFLMLPLKRTKRKYNAQRVARRVVLLM